MSVRRIFVEKKKGFDVEAGMLLGDLKNNLGISGLKSVRIINRYDVEGISDEEYNEALNTIFSEPPVDNVFSETIELSGKVFAIEYLPGQYDQRADSAAQCVQILSRRERPRIRVAKLIVLEGDVSDEEYKRVKDYCINPVESREASMDKPKTIETEVDMPSDVSSIEGFITMTESGLSELMASMGFAMSLEDLKFCQNYFRDTEKRNPTVTEIRMIDTYWSDHCRHTTFLTEIEDVKFEGYGEVIKKAYESYRASRKYVYGDKAKERDVCLMDMATIAMKELRKKGLLDDLDVSDEINACSICVNVDVDGKEEEWLVMFKNETHNHPTEIEPFGGAATCLGGAIRDPLSGRSYVYQAMRVTGSGDPRTSVKDTLQGKLPQRKITTGAASGYSSYGNQIGLATGQIAEIYDEGYVAKRMEIGAVIGAAPKSNVVREVPEAGDIIILLGGRTGRDGCGGATGSSKEHDEESLVNCGAEVQKGNPPTERKIQRLFRKQEVSTLIKRCNDFGAGGVSVAIGELADGLIINLDAVPIKYEGIDGTELAISESQERMAVVVSNENVKAFINAADEENLEATEVAVVTAEPRLRMIWRGKTIVDIGRDFLNTNGVKQKVSVEAALPQEGSYFNKKVNDGNIETLWTKNLSNLNVCSQKGLVERFDSTIGAGTVTMPFGGKYQLSPAEGMAAKVPVPGGKTNTATLMTYGFSPNISRWSPFHGAVFAVVESVAKITAMGGDYSKARLTLQEYFEKLGKEPQKWGKPFSALLGAYYAQVSLGISAIGGKDSMSGTFKDLNVPPTLVSFAVGIADADKVVSTEFKGIENKVVMIPLKRDSFDMPDFSELKKNYAFIKSLISEGKVLSSHSVREGGVAEAISKMCFGNMIGFEFENELNTEFLFEPLYGSIILELSNNCVLDSIFKGINYKELGHTIEKKTIMVNGISLDLKVLLDSWQQPLEKIFPTKAGKEEEASKTFAYAEGTKKTSAVSVAKPRVFIPVFPGTNCEYDTASAFRRAGGIADVFVVRNLTAKAIEESIEQMVKRIDASQIIMIPGGFSGGDEPDGSGKFIATAFRNPYVKESVMRLLNERDGLILGICNGFQALIKLGLVPYGEIRDIKDESPTLTFNTIGRHVSCMVNTKVISTKSPWFNNVKPGDVHAIAVSHGEGRFVASPEVIKMLEKNSQVATQYVDTENNPTYDMRFNPNGSVHAIEGITSPDGRVLGKMGHSERIGTNIAKNVPGEKDQKIFEAGVGYFK